MVGKKDKFMQKGNQHSKSSLSACPLPIFFLLLLHIFALSPVSSQCFSVWRCLLLCSPCPPGLRGLPHALCMGSLEHPLWKCWLNHRDCVMPDPCKLKICISTTDCMYRFGKQRYRVFWGMVGKMDWMTWERTDRQACTIAFLYLMGIWMEKWALELTTGLSGAGDAKWCMSFGYQCKSVYLDNLYIKLHKELDWQLIR